ncbi:uncharacterized protein LOC133650737 isoform X3 [Entelurus aequoreus]|uniref:uncharacterized protein LOC133650737 isoform X3 n=1 Tax=Entelurus aequoreus TaxID=161455 RepID=UPI002B1E6A98|nr:uncharacterized protein LOC133650737 isoform X3 [Entelurus aequoreus]
MLPRNSSGADDLLGNSSHSRPGNVEQVLVPFFDVLILVLGLAGHSTVMFILCRRHRKRAGQSAQSSMTGTAFLLPLITITIAYGNIYLFLWRTQNAGQAPQVERYQNKSSGATGTSPRYGAFTVFSRLTAIASTVLNPMLYVLTSQKFRQDLLRLFKKEGQRASGGAAT